MKIALVFFCVYTVKHTCSKLASQELLLLLLFMKTKNGKIKMTQILYKLKKFPLFSLKLNVENVY